MVPDLLLGAYDDGQLGRYCLGVSGYDSGIELKGIAVTGSHRWQGIAASLLGRFEANTAIHILTKSLNKADLSSSTVALVVVILRLLYLCRCLLTPLFDTV